MKISNLNLIILMALVLFGTSYVFFFKYFQNEISIAERTSASSSTNLYLNIAPGTLSQKVASDVAGTNEIIMSKTDIFTAPPGGTSSTGKLTTQIKDHRGTSVGWSQTATCSDFTATGGTIAVTNFTVTPNSLLGLGVTPTTGVHLGPAHTFANTSDVALLVKADAGSGTGRYQVESLLDLHIDKITPVGIYTAVMTITIS